MSVYEAHVVTLLRRLRDALVTYRAELEKESKLRHYDATSGMWSLKRAVKWLDEAIKPLLPAIEQVVGPHSAETRTAQLIGDSSYADTAAGPAWHLHLNRYQRDNLLDALRALKTRGGDTGDWLAEVSNVLAMGAYALHPNQPMASKLDDWADTVNAARHLLPTLIAPFTLTAEEEAAARTAASATCPHAQMGETFPERCLACGETATEIAEVAALELRKDAKTPVERIPLAQLAKEAMDRMSIATPAARMAELLEEDGRTVAIPGSITEAPRCKDPRCVVCHADQRMEEPEEAVDLDLLRRFAMRLGGRRTGALMRMGYLHAEVTAAGRAALGLPAAAEHSGQKFQKIAPSAALTGSRVETRVADSEEIANLNKVLKDERATLAAAQHTIATLEQARDLLMAQNASMKADLAGYRLSKSHKDEG